MVSSHGINPTHGLKKYKHEFAPQVMLMHYHKNGNGTSNQEWMSNLFWNTFWIFPILEYYFLGCPTFLLLIIIRQQGAQVARELWYSCRNECDIELKSPCGTLVDYHKTYGD